MPQSPLPRAPRDAVVEILHGDAVADPFRPLEDSGSPATRAWIDAQDAHARSVLDIPARAEAEAYFKKIWDAPTASPPMRYGGLHFYWFNDGERAQTEFRVREGLHGEPRTLIDPNLLSNDGTVALGGAFVSPDGRHVAYLLSEAGSDRQILRIREVETGRDLPETLRRCRFTSIAWTPDGDGFLYNRCPDPEGPEDQTWIRRFLVCRHRLGTDQTADEVILHPGAEGRFLTPRRFRGTPFFGVTVAKGTSEKNGFLFSRDGAAGSFVSLIEPDVASFDPIGVISEDDRDVLYAKTNLDAPRERIVALNIDGDHGPHAWRTIIPESDDTIDDGRLVLDKLLVFRNTGLETKIRLHRRDGVDLGPLDIPGPPGPATSYCGGDDPAHPEVFLGSSGWRAPAAVWRYDAAAGDLTLIHQNPSVEDLSDADIETLWATSRDGVRIPMTVIRPRGSAKTGDAPVLMRGYGGYGLSERPSFNKGALHWIKRGGIYVNTCLRGGGEFGQDWHDGGRLRRKQNTFDDFIACAETLIAEGWTRPERLAIMGGSNGGLLVAACMLQRPDLFGAVVCSVPVTDMLRFHKFTAGLFWISDYGDPDDPEDFAVLRRYSPLHNVKPGAKYPPILIMTGDHDDRVAPLHAYKFAATLQETADPNGVVLLRVDRRAGHGAGKPKEKVIAELADREAFLTMALGLRS